MRNGVYYKYFGISALNICIFFICAYFDAGVLIAFCAVILHETGHICAILICGKRIRKIDISSFGIEIETGLSETTYTEDALISLAGPISNIFGALVCVFSHISFCRVFFVCNVFLALLNLLPIIPLDGGNALYYSLCRISGLDFALKASKTVSFIFCFILWIFGIYFLFYHQSNASLLKLCFYLFVSVLFGSENGGHKFGEYGRKKEQKREKKSKSKNYPS